MRHKIDDEMKTLWKFTLHPRGAVDLAPLTADGMLYVLADHSLWALDSRWGFYYFKLPLLAKALERLRERAAQAGMELVVLSTVPETSRVRVDQSAVERILFNLVDNASKYASSADDKRIHVEVESADSFATIKVRDHGPGVSGGLSRRIFRPFSKSAHDAANSAPGVGLGLSLSRRLARSLGGELSLDPASTGGACFVLSLPLEE